MRVVRLSIQNFRGIKTAQLLFDGHTLLVGPNNVGKSTICEALDLALSPDRLSRTPAIDEFDFYNATYLEPGQANEGAEPAGESTREPTLVPLRIEVVLVDLSESVSNHCGGNLEFWHVSEQRLLGDLEADLAAPHVSVPCLRLETVGQYNQEEDEFEAKTYFSHSPDADDGELTQVPRRIKREFGFLYLRALRTGSRALTLERGSLLDIILRTKGIRTSLWEKTIRRLRDFDVEADAEEIAPVLREIERRLSRYIALEAPSNATRLHVSELTREHLRKTLAFFIALSSDQCNVPFAHAGMGTLNTLVLALLSFIADLKTQAVIFAMEEPEIALPPHTQRRIAEYLFAKTSQSFVTSHSPFVIERFEPSNTLLLSRAEGIVTAQRVSDASGLTHREFKQYSRWGLCECILGKAAIVVEGLTEFHAMPTAAARLEREEPAVTRGHPLDILGATFFYAGGESNMPKFGRFFKALGLSTFAFYDLNPKRPTANTQALAEVYDINREHAYRGFEALVASEMPVGRLWKFLETLKVNGEEGDLGIPSTQPPEANVRRLASDALKSGKGVGWAARLFEECDYAELPPSVMHFLREVFAAMPQMHDEGHADEVGSERGSSGSLNKQ